MRLPHYALSGFFRHDGMEEGLAQSCQVLNRNSLNRNSLAPETT